MVKKLWASLHGDNWIKLCIILLMVMSALIVFSSTSPLSYKNTHDTSHMFYSHIGKMVLSLGALWVFSRITVRITIKCVDVLYYISLALLLVVKFYSAEVNGASRWIDLGFITFQPSEFAKVVLMLFLAKHLSSPEKNVLRTIVLYMLPVTLIFLENGSTGILLITSGLFIVLLSGVFKFRYVCLAGVGLVLLFAVVAYFELFPRLSTWSGRISRFINGAADIQADYSMIAVASGGLGGVGLGNSDMKNFLPLSFADYIFAIVLEETGAVGLILTLVAYGLMFKRIRDYAMMSERKFESYALLGLGGMYTFQAIMHMFVNVGLFPVTGQTLPLVSWGGTSGIFVCIAYGTILSITHDIQQSKKQVINSKTTKTKEPCE